MSINCRFFRSWVDFFFGIILFNFRDDFLREVLSLFYFIVEETRFGEGLLLLFIDEIDDKVWFRFYVCS